MKINAIQFEKAIKQLNNFTSSRDYKESLKGIHVIYKTGDDFIKLEACDSFVANLITLEVVADEYDKDVDVILLPFKYKASKYYNDVEINFVDMYLISDGIKSSLNIASYEEYPNLEKLFPSDAYKMISINVKTLKTLLKGLNDTDNVEINLSDKTNCCIVNSIENTNLFKENRMLGVIWKREGI